MLSLESEILNAILPPVRGLDVLDLGCGTGRWLAELAEEGARRLTGIDASADMLEQAHAKLGDRATLLLADCAEPPPEGLRADLVLCNFVLSYLPDPARFLRMAADLLREGGSLFLTDLHPQTSAQFDWSRGPRGMEKTGGIRTNRLHLDGILGMCRDAGLRITTFLQPTFGAHQRAIFEANGKADYFQQIREFPPIYILQLQCRRNAEDDGASTHAEPMQLRGVRVALGATLSDAVDVRVKGGTIAALLSRSEEVPVESATGFGADVDLSGYLLLPGLVNAHDHLEFALYPRLGRGAYRNFLEWVEDIYHPGASPVAEHRGVPKATRLWWGAIRNLLCGVTSVCHHNPHNEVFDQNFGVRVLRDFGWAHSVCMDPDFARKKSETPAGQPFLLHAAEGVDDVAAAEMNAIRAAGALDQDTIVVHGLGMDARQRSAFRAARAGLIWCPSSNLFLFGNTFSAREIRGFPKVALGSDSPLTAEGDLLDEASCAARLGVAAEDIYAFVMRSAAQLLGMRRGEGTIRHNGVADLVAVRDHGEPPAEALGRLTYRDVKLVVLGGRVQLASPAMKERLPAAFAEALQPLSVEGHLRWIRAPLDRLFAETTPHLGNDLRLGGKQVRYGE